MNFIKHLSTLYNTFLNSSNPTHKFIINSIIKSLELLEADTKLMLQELCIITATGKWLDEWGSWFGVKRRKNEMDTEFSERIILSIKSAKSTLQALKEHSANFLNYEYENGYHNKYTPSDIEIFEPWTKLFSYSHRGELSGNHRFPDSSYWRRNVIDISIPEDITKDFILMINKIKAAGIHVLYTVSPLMRSEVILASDPNSKNLADFFLAFENIIVSLNEGFMLSEKTSINGSLSGRRTIWGTEASTVFNFAISNMFRIWEDSFIFRNKTFHIYELIKPKILPSLVFSEKKGVISGYYKKTEKIIKIEKELTPIDKKHLQSEVLRELLFLSLSVMSVEGSLSNNAVFSGAFGEDYKLLGYKTESQGFIKIPSDLNLIRLDFMKNFTISAKIKNYEDDLKILSGSKMVWGSNVVLDILNKINMHPDLEYSEIFRKNTLFENPISFSIPKKDFSLNLTKHTTINELINETFGMDINQLIFLKSNIKEPYILSEKQGLLSNTPNKSLNKLIYDLNDIPYLQRGFIQSPVRRDLLFIKPHKWSEHDSYSENVILSGALNESLEYETRISKTDSFIKYPPNKIFTSNDLNIGIYHKENKDNILSGRRILLNNFFIDIKLIVNNEFNFFSYLLSVNDLLDLGKEKNIANLIEDKIMVGHPHSSSTMLILSFEVSVKVKEGEKTSNSIICFENFIKDSKNNFESDISINYEGHIKNYFNINSYILCVNDLLYKFPEESLDSLFQDETLNNLCA